MLPIPDTQHNHKWAATLVKTKPNTFGQIEELQTFTPMYGLGLEGPIVDEILESLFAVTNRNRTQLRQALQCSLLTLAQCIMHASSSTVYSFVHRRGTNQAKAVLRYKDRSFSDTHMTKVLDALASCGYVRYEKGFKGKDVPMGLATLWLVDSSFASWVSEHIESLKVVQFVEQRETVVLNNEAGGEKRKDYDENDQTHSMRQRIISGNKARTLHEWTYIPMDRVFWEEGSRRRGKVKKEYRQFMEGDERHLISPKSLECRRVFKGDFESGGRFYCGAQSLTKAERGTIQIDGEPTIELDLKSLHPRLLYNLEGFEAPEDCYEADTKEQRARNKMICLYLINNKDRVTARRAFMADFGGTGDEADTEFDTYIEQHPKIAHHFFKSSWKRLQFMDSRIVDAVLSAAVDKGVALLPIHDSFITKTRDAYWLNDVIRESYCELIGFEPVLDW
ncbi:hypothetical protein WNY58_01090 [Neptuniibacter pectenicola]|jgi:hypothetical protein|uniref:Uncharacterized protein n=1 Tax=Neptuniibacter pectenicola TaxID=1806669 RepID=A0ABU9TMP1_9GAMM